VKTDTAARRAASSLVAARTTLTGDTALDDDDTAVVGVDLDVLDAQLASLRAAFPPSVRHAVAIKTMPHHRMLGHLVAAGFGLEAASLEEVTLALDAGAVIADLIFDSPVKTRSEIAWCQANLAGALLNANSIDELHRYPDAPAFQVGLRINPELDTGAPSRFDVSGLRSKFGVPLSMDRSVVIDACIEAGVTALHMHIGSQVPNCDAHVEAVGRLLDVAAEIDAVRGRRCDGRRITTIDIGGGIRSEAEDAELMSQYGQRLQSEHARLFDYDVRTEFGQWVHANAGWAASRVESIEERAVPMAFLHLGADFFMRDVYTDRTGTANAGGLPYDIAVVRADGRVSVATDEQEPTRRYDLVGPLCFAGDVLARDLPLPELAEGDWLVFAGTGANTFGLWSRHCSRAIPRVVASSGGACHSWSRRCLPC
jgi:diaminopimelate decarboxylase